MKILRFIRFLIKDFFWGTFVMIGKEIWEEFKKTEKYYHCAECDFETNDKKEAEKHKPYCPRYAGR